MATSTGSRVAHADAGASTDDAVEEIVDGWPVVSKNPATGTLRMPIVSASTNLWKDGDHMTFGRCRSVGHYEKIVCVGAGMYGRVYKARDRKTGQIVALKKVILHNEKADGFPLTALREILALHRCKHPNIVELKEVVVSRKRENVFLVFEYCEHDMACLIDSMKTPFEEAQVKCLMLQLLRAVAHCHARFIMHRDLKMSNVLYLNGVVKLADFGLARQYTYPHGRYTPKVVTLWYRPPELLLGATEYTCAADMWATGCIFGELLNHAPLIAYDKEVAQLEGIFKLLGSANEDIWPGFNKLPNVPKIRFDMDKYRYNNLSSKFPKLSPLGLDLLSGLLTYDPRKRYTVEQALHHEYFSEFPPPAEPTTMPRFADSRGLPIQHSGSGARSGVASKPSAKRVKLGGRRRLRPGSGGGGRAGFARGVAASELAADAQAPLMPDLGDGLSDFGVGVAASTGANAGIGAGAGAGAGAGTSAIASARAPRAATKRARDGT